MSHVSKIVKILPLELGRLSLSQLAQLSAFGHRLRRAGKITKRWDVWGQWDEHGTPVLAYFGVEDATCVLDAITAYGLPDHTIVWCPNGIRRLNNWEVTQIGDGFVRLKKIPQRTCRPKTERVLVMKGDVHFMTEVPCFSAARFDRKMPDSMFGGRAYKDVPEWYLFGNLYGENSDGSANGRKRWEGKLAENIRAYLKETMTAVYAYPTGECRPEDRIVVGYEDELDRWLEAEAVNAAVRAGEEKAPEKEGFDPADERNGPRGAFWHHRFQLGKRELLRVIRPKQLEFAWDRPSHAVAGLGGNRNLRCAKDLKQLLATQQEAWEGEVKHGLSEDSQLTYADLIRLKERMDKDGVEYEFVLQPKGYYRPGRNPKKWTSQEKMFIEIQEGVEFLTKKLRHPPEEGRKYGMKFTSQEMKDLGWRWCRETAELIVTSFRVHDDQSVEKVVTRYTAEVPPTDDLLRLGKKPDVGVENVRGKWPKYLLPQREVDLSVWSDALLLRDRLYHLFIALRERRPVDAEFGDLVVDAVYKRLDEAGLEVCKISEKAPKKLTEYLTSALEVVGKEAEAYFFGQDVEEPIEAESPTPEPEEEPHANWVDAQIAEAVEKERKKLYQMFLVSRKYRKQRATQKSLRAEAVMEARAYALLQSAPEGEASREYLARRDHRHADEADLNLDPLFRCRILMRQYAQTACAKKQTARRIACD
jgi:hypothetical protein